MERGGQDPRSKALDQASAGRRAAMLRFAIQRQEAKHYSEALDVYRRLIEEYPGTEEESEARERMLDLAWLFGVARQPYRMLSLYNTLETLYAPASTERTTEARRARVRQILEEVREQKQREAEAQARIEAIREGVGMAPGAARRSSQRKEPASGPRRAAGRRQGVRGVD